MADAGVMTEARPIATDLPEPTPIKTLQEKYSELAARYRTLGRQQLAVGLNQTQSEWKERQELDQLRKEGFFDPSLTEGQLQLKERALKANQEPTSQENLAAEYQRLGKIQIKRQLDTEEKARFDYLTDLAKRGELEAKSTNNPSEIVKAA